MLRRSTVCDCSVSGIFRGVLTSFFTDAANRPAEGAEEAAEEADGTKEAGGTEEAAEDDNAAEEGVEGIREETRGTEDDEGTTGVKLLGAAHPVS